MAWEEQIGPVGRGLATALEAMTKRSTVSMARAVAERAMHQVRGRRLDPAATHLFHGLDHARRYDNRAFLRLAARTYREDVARAVELGVADRPIGRWGFSLGSAALPDLPDIDGLPAVRPPRPAISSEG